MKLTLKLIGLASIIIIVPFYVSVCLRSISSNDTMFVVAGAMGLIIPVCVLLSYCLSKFSKECLNES